VGLQRLRLGLIGAGRRGQAHAATTRELPELYELVAVGDVNEASARAMAAPAGARAYGDVAELLSQERPDVVVIVTPPDSHHLVARIAAERGVHLLIETPLGLTRAMMDVIGEAADKTGVQVEVGENYGRRPSERLNYAALRAGQIGRVVHLSAFNAPANHDSAYHIMSLFQRYTGAEVTEIRAYAHRTALNGSGDGGPDAESWIDAMLSYENGISASCSYVTSWTTPLRWGRPRIITVEGTEGYIVTADGGMNTLHRLDHGAGRDIRLRVETGAGPAQKIPTRYVYDTIPELSWSNPFADRVLTDAEPAGIADGLARTAELVSLHRAVSEGAAPEYGIAAARRSQELGIAIIEAARVGQPISSKLRAETLWEREQHEALRQRWGAGALRVTRR